MQATRLPTCATMDEICVKWKGEDVVVLLGATSGKKLKRLISKLETTVSGQEGGRPPVAELQKLLTYVKQCLEKVKNFGTEDEESYAFVDQDIISQTAEAVDVVSNCIDSLSQIHPDVRVPTLQDLCLPCISQLKENELVNVEMKQENKELVTDKKRKVCAILLRVLEWSLWKMQASSCLSECQAQVTEILEASPYYCLVRKRTNGEDVVLFEGKTVNINEEEVEEDGVEEEETKQNQSCNNEGSSKPDNLSQLLIALSMLEELVAKLRAKLEDENFEDDVQNFIAQVRQLLTTVRNFLLPLKAIRYERVQQYVNTFLFLLDTCNVSLGRYCHKNNIRSFCRVSRTLLSCISSSIKSLKTHLNEWPNFEPRAKVNEQLKSVLPVILEALNVGLLGVLGGLLGVGAATAGLSILGFTTSGVAAGSFAAAWMSTYGGTVAAGSLFATLQSAGVVGFGMVATGGIAAVGGAVAVGAYLGYKGINYLREKKRLAAIPRRTVDQLLKTL